MNQQHLLKVSNLKTYFYVGNKVFKAVDDVNFTIDNGEVVCIVGESGSGKSMTSLSVMGLVPQPPGKIKEGSILFNGRELTKLSNREMSAVRGNEIAMIFQEPMSSLNPVLTIGFQINEGLIEHKKLKKKEAKKKTMELLHMVGFAQPEDIFNSYPHQLSGGMRQRAMIAMAISCNPKLLIADEPTTALDVTIQAQILGLMRDVKNELNSSILLITHDLGVVAEMADRVLVMYGGQIVEEASVERIFDDPKHPYTLGLMGSMPRLDEEFERLDQIKGMVPSSNNFPNGCRFAPRCKHAMPECTIDSIEMKEVDHQHKVRCILYDSVLGEVE